LKPSLFLELLRLFGGLLFLLEVALAFHGVIPRRLLVRRLKAHLQLPQHLLSFFLLGVSLSYRSHRFSAFAVADSLEVPDALQAFSELRQVHLDLASCFIFLFAVLAEAEARHGHGKEARRCAILLCCLRLVMELSRGILRTALPVIVLVLEIKFGLLVNDEHVCRGLGALWIVPTMEMADPAAATLTVVNACEESLHRHERLLIN